MTSSTSSPPTGSPREGTPPGPTARGLFVRIAIFLTALIFIGTIVVIYYRWVTVEEPSGVVLVDGNETLEGAVVVLDGVALPQPLVGELSSWNSYRTRFFLHPGSYVIQVMLNDEPVYQHQFSVQAGGPHWRIDLTDFGVDAPREP